jgi:hypothetical protein
MKFTHFCDLVRELLETHYKWCTRDEEEYITLTTVDRQWLYNMWNTNHSALNTLNHILNEHEYLQNRYSYST